MKVLVTGANGFVGRALCAHLASGRHHVVAAVRASHTGMQDQQIVTIDALDQNTDWRNAFQGVDAVVHLAARVHILRVDAGDSAGEFQKINVAATLNLARQAAAAGVKRFVFLSSVKVNGEVSPPGQPFCELDAPNPQDHYGHSKYEAEKGLRQIADTTSLQVVIIRPPLVYGPGAKANFGALMAWVARGWPLPLGGIHNIRSLVGLDNLVDFVATCLTHPAAANQTFFVSDRQDISSTALVHALADAAGVRAHLLPVPASLLMAMARSLGKGAAAQRLCQTLQVDTAKAGELLGWVPPVSLQLGLQHAMRSQRRP